LTHRATHRDIERWRRAGLIVDEDFERGVAPRRRQRRNLALATIVVGLAVTGWFALISPHADAARRHRARPPHESAPMRPSSVHRGRLTV